MTYRVLVVDPMQPKPRSNRHDTAASAEPRALHICRGHFADYTQGAGLFGRLHGRYWVPMHVRGSVDAGIAAKDYRVVPDAAGDQHHRPDCSC